MIERNRADELERFKSHINLTEYMAAQGYKLDKAESSRHSAVMRGPGDDKLIVAKGQDGHWVYFSVRDEADNGSIIDFVQRRQALNLGQVRQALRPWIGEAAERPSPAIEHYARIVLPSSPDRQRVACALAKAPPADRPAGPTPPDRSDNIPSAGSSGTGREGPEIERGTRSSKSRR